MRYTAQDPEGRNQDPEGRSYDPEGRDYDPELARMIDHTLLRPEATAGQIRALCHEASTYRFASVCIHPLWVPLAAETLAGRGVAVCTVVGFPHGAQPTDVKAFEAELAVRQGAGEIDMVIPIGALKQGDHSEVARHVERVIAACQSEVLVKVIIEACLLSDEEKRQACRIAADCGAAFVKTSTGFSSAGATESDVQLMREAVGPNCGVKAAGGIRDRETALRMIRAGANRIGTSAGPALILL